MNEIEEAQAVLARRRQAVVAKARQGGPPREYWSDEELERMFATCPEELAELEQQAADFQAARAERMQANRERQVLDRVTRRVLSERDKADRAARYADAEAEARRRISEGAL